MSLICGLRVGDTITDQNDQSWLCYKIVPGEDYDNWVHDHTDKISTNRRSHKVTMRSPDLVFLFNLKTKEDKWISATHVNQFLQRVVSTADKDKKLGEVLDIIHHRTLTEEVKTLTGVLQYHKRTRKSLAQGLEQLIKASEENEQKMTETRKKLKETKVELAELSELMQS